MGMEFKKPLIIGDIDASVKSDISQIKQDISNIESDIGSLDNLTTTDKSSLVGAINEVNTLLPPTSQRDYIDNSKAMPTGAVSTNDLILPEIKAYAHSTFDRSKFTVVGSPNITDDGIASGFSNSNYITVPVDFSKPFKIELPILTSNSWQTGTNCYPCRSNTEGFYVQITPSGYLTVNVGDTAWTPNIISRSMQLSLNTKYIISLEWTGTTYIIKVNGTQIGNVVSSTTQILNATFLLLGGYPRAAVSYSFNGSIDLKQFSITVDGVEVFSGNRTGIDTIKPDDYTSNGSSISSLITNDGILGYNLADSNTNYIESPSITLGNNFDIYVRYKLISAPSAFRIFGENSGTSILRGYISNYSLALNFTASDDSTISIPNISTTDAQLGQWCTLKFSFDGTKYVATIYNENGASIGTATLTSSLLPKYTKFNTQGGSTSASANYQIDLNELKIYVNGDLAWQPCLKIPYTESKTGSKIVDAIYRDRVADMSAQFGYANYYTLQNEPKGNYAVVGSPTISSDFVASGLSGSNYLLKSNIEITGNKVVFEGNFTWNGTNPSGSCFLYTFKVSNQNTKFALYQASNGKIALHTTISGTDYYNFGDVTISANSPVYYTITLTSSSLGMKVVQNGVEIYNLVKTEHIPTFTTNSTLLIGGTTNRVIEGIFDLKQFNIYVDNKLVYEAVTEPNFTLPQVELYGLIGQRTLRDSYRNGINYWELYSNRDLEQGGSCTSGVEVTFARPFADTNYVLSVPYSAKSSTAFTPTQTGDWIAKGKGIL